MQLLSWPAPYHGNPYLSRLTAALRDEGVESISHRYLAGLAASHHMRAPRARWLHVHWPEWMLQDTNVVRARARALWFFALVDSLRAQGIKLLWTAHNLIGHDDPHPALGLELRRRWLARCSAVLGHFASAEQSVRELGFVGRFLLSPHPHAADDYGLDEGTDRAELRRVFECSPEGLLLVGFGAIEHYKGFDRLVSAFVAHADRNDRLVIAGAARKRDELAAVLRATRTDERVSLRPWHHSRAESAQLLTAADALVLSYRQFFTSGTAMLALTMGAAVIGPAEHHLSAIAGEPFFFAMPSVEADFAGALARLRATSDSAIRTRAQRWAMQWTYQAMARKIAELLREQ